MGNFIGKIPGFPNPKSAPLPQSAESATPSTSARRRTARARRPLPPPSESNRRASAAQTVLPDEIWEDIFLRLNTAADLARAAATCSFRSIISDRRFLRRFRSLNSPTVLGFICRIEHQFLPIEPPHRSAPEARALELAADFTFSFVPEPDSWEFLHASDGRVLLSKRMAPGTEFEDFLVCDPLYRRYVKIPRIPDDLRASALNNGLSHHLFPILAPAGENDNDLEESSFRVICTVQLVGKVVVFIFSSCNQMWRGMIRTICLPPHGYLYSTDYAHGCVHWMLDCTCYSLMLDSTSEMELSITELPPHNFDTMCAIVEAADGRLGLVIIRDGTVILYCKNWQCNGVGAQEWQHDKLIPLPKDSETINYRWANVGTEGRYLALLGTARIWHESRNSEYFVLDTETLLLEKVYISGSNVVFHGIPYARFPPPFALPSI